MALKSTGSSQGYNDTAIREALEIIDEHVHSYERWFGSTAGVAPGLETNMTPFRVTSAGVANTFGAPILMFDGTETPAQVGALSFDPHRIQIVNVQNNGVTWRLRLANNINGAANYAAAVLAGDYTDVVLSIDKTQADSVPVSVQTKRLPNGTIIWSAVATSNAIAQWLDFVIGIHEYDNTAPFPV